MTEELAELVKARKDKRKIKTDIAFECIESISEKTRANKHYAVNATTGIKIKELCEGSEYNECELASAVVCEAAECGWKPFPDVKERKINFSDLDGQFGVALTGDEYQLVEKVAKAQCMRVGDYMRLALNWRLVLDRPFKK